MHARLTLAALAISAQAAVVTGVVVDAESTRPLARTVVTLTPIHAGTGATARTESNGTFFIAAAPGVYLLTLSKPGFATLRFGAKCWNCPGMALSLNGDERTAVNATMHRLGAITGTVFDENQIGIPEIPVHVFTATRPMRPAGKAITDDRGMFRIGELPPGQYVVRTQATLTPEGMTYLASYYPEGTEARMARSGTVELERTWANVDFPLVAGKVFNVRGRVTSPFPGMATSIDLISDAGRRKATVDGQGNFNFDAVAPGNYEIYAEGRDRSGSLYAAWQPLAVEHDMDVVAQMALGARIVVNPTGENRKRILDNSLQVKMRRKDLDQEGPVVTIRGIRESQIAAGNWEISADAGPESYAKEITVAGGRAESRAKGSAEGWNVAKIGSGYPVVDVTISNHAASITGHVSDRPNETVAYAPVFLETLDLEPPDPPLVRQARTRADGTFAFKGLPPGRYWLLSSFDLDGTDQRAMEAAQPAELTLSEGSAAIHDVVLYRRP
jgi:hypothetical protein